MTSATVMNVVTPTQDSPLPVMNAASDKNATGHRDPARGPIEKLG
jgi:hypothetical protein